MSTPNVAPNVAPNAFVQEALKIAREQNETALQLGEAVKTLKQAEDEFIAARRNYKNLVRNAHELGIPIAKIAKIVGVSRQRISQII